MSKNKKFVQSKIFKLIVMPLLLLALWFGLTILYIINFDTSLSVLSYVHGPENFNNITYNKLLKGDKISGTITAKENGLGIIAVKFQTFIRPAYQDEDRLLFRLKQKGAKTWYYQNKYRIGLVYDIPIFPFGFPRIADSKGKTYYFEIESLKGNANNSVALSDRGQILFSKYQIAKSDITRTKKTEAAFAIKKFVNEFLTTDVRFSSFIYLLPLIFYLLFMSPLGKMPRTKINVLLKDNSIFKSILYFLGNKFHWIIIVIVLVDIFIIQLTNDIVYLIILFLWITVLHVYKIKSKYSFIFAFILLIIPPVFLLLRDSVTAEKGAVWSYIFFVAGLLQSFIDVETEILPGENLKK